jgi:hypothetical protein
MADIIPPKRGEEITNQGKASLRLSEYLEALTTQTNTNTGEIETAPIESALAYHFALEARLGSGNALTSDETGFTVDSDKLTVDMTEA